jgi:hypothetical protein
MLVPLCMTFSVIDVKPVYILMVVRCVCISAVRVLMSVYILIVVPLWMHLRVRDVKPVYIHMMFKLCMHFRSGRCEASLHPYGGAVVYEFQPCVKWSQRTTLGRYHCVCISAVHDVKPLYILMVVPLCMRTCSALCDANVHAFGFDIVYGFPSCVTRSQCSSLRWWCYVVTDPSTSCQFNLRLAPLLLLS